MARHQKPEYNNIFKDVCDARITQDVNLGDPCITNIPWAEFISHLFQPSILSIFYI